MIELSVRKSSRQVWSVVIPVTILALCSISRGYADPVQPTRQPVFASAAEAIQSLFDAVQRNDEEAIANILGAQTGLTSSSDPHQDKVERELFVEKYREMHRVGREADGSGTLYIGAENWPFPIPLVQKDAAWHFDPETGAREVTMRRIGENELKAIITCHEFIAAANRYRAQADNGDLELSAPASLVARAADGSKSSEPVALQGYYFKVLAMDMVNTPRVQRFAVIAYPVEYRSSGVMTFIVTEKDIVYEKDLGPNSAALATAMNAFRKDASWRASQE
jgi:hypothetical protein